MVVPPPTKEREKNLFLFLREMGRIKRKKKKTTSFEVDVSKLTKVKRIFFSRFSKIGNRSTMSSDSDEWLPFLGSLQLLYLNFAFYL